MLIFNVFYFQAISNPRSEIQQERAWDAVCPLVSQLKRYYEFSLALGMFFLFCLNVLETDYFPYIKTQ